MNKQTQKRAEDLELLLTRELTGFYLGRELKKPVFGALDLPIFGLRFRFIPTNPIEDKGWEVIEIPSQEYLETDDLLFLLAKRGYLHWLRTKVSPQKWHGILESKDRWKKILQYALKRAQEDNSGMYKISFYKMLLNKYTLQQILGEYPDTFDWILN